MRGISDCVDIEFIVSDIKSLQVMEHYDLVITAESTFTRVTFRNYRYCFQTCGILESPQYENIYR